MTSFLRVTSLTEENVTTLVKTRQPRDTVELLNASELRLIPEPWIEHIELQAGRDIGLSDRVHYYNTSLGRAHSVPVHSTIVLLRPAADGPDVNGIHERRYRNGDVYDWFRYDVLRIWEQPVEV